MKYQFNIFKIILIFLSVIFLINTQINAQPQPIPGSFEFEGHVRNYEVFLPQNFQPDSPLIIILHGYLGTLHIIKSSTELHLITDTTSTIAVYPKSASISWNTGETVPPYGWPPYDPTVNDVGFISALIDTLDNQYDIDMDRIYVCGFSSGGEMTFRLVNELGHRFAAAASVSGPLNDVTAANYPIRPFPVLHMHGTLDPLISYYNPYGNLWSVDSTLNFYVRNNNCIGSADTVSLPDIDTTDNCTVDKISFTNCSGNNHVIHYKIVNGGHSWPSTNYNSPLYRNINKDIKASVEIVNFFNNYTNPNVAYGKSIEVNPKYLDPLGDTLSVLAEIKNPANHQVEVYAMIQNDDTTFQDSIQLFDDGLHNDGNPNDNIYGGAKWYSGLNEDYFTTTLNTSDITVGTKIKSRFRTQFTTIGPVVVDSMIQDTLLGDYLFFTPVLKNEGFYATAQNIKMTMLYDDTLINSIQNHSQSFGNIVPGGTATSSNYYIVETSNLHGHHTFNFTFKIYSKNQHYWSDHKEITVFFGVDGINHEEDPNRPTEFSLKQNYPNPFNPSTTIKYTLPKPEKVKIEIFNLLGQKITTLLKKRMQAGSHEVEFTAKDLPSGVYLYRIVVDSYGEAGNYFKMRKMILIK